MILFLEKTKDLLPVCQNQSSGGSLLLFLVIRHGCLNGVFSKHGAMKLNWRELQMLGDISVFNVHGILNALALEYLSCVWAASDCASTSESLKHRLFDGAVIVDLDLKLHNISTGRGSDKSSSHARVLLIQRTDVSWIVVVIEHILMIGESPQSLYTQDSLLLLSRQAEQRIPDKILHFSMNFILNIIIDLWLILLI